mgnify:CR=1 FL=1
MVDKMMVGTRVFGLGVILKPKFYLDKIEMENKRKHLVKQTNMEKRYLSIKECSEYTGLSVTTLYRWSNERRIPYHKLGHILRFDVKEIDKWFAKLKYSVSREIPKNVGFQKEVDYIKE